MSWLSRMANAVRPGRLHAALDEEQEFHVEERTRELIGQGMAPGEARATARRQFGNRLQIREESYDARALVWFESVLRDIRFSLRMLRRERTVTVAAVLSLSLALGACTAAFSLIDGLILRPLPVPRPNELVQLSYPGTARPGAIGEPEDDEGFSYALFQRFRQAASTEVDLFGATFSNPFQTVTFQGSDSEQRVRAESLSGNGFDALGLRPAAGRLFTADDDRPPAGRQVAVLSHTFWLRQFGGAPSAVGQWMTLAGKQFQIVGVAQEGFTGLQPGYLTDLWVPLVTSVSAARLANPDATWMQVWGRMRTGRPVGMAREELQAAFTNFRKELDGVKFREIPLRVRSAATGRASLFRKQFKRPLWILGLISALILAIACSNVANLLIARGAARGREMALRISIGAGRWRLVQQLLIESAILALASSVVGLAFAANAAPLAVSQLGPSDFPAYLNVGVDARVFGFAVLCAVVTALAFGLIPALRFRGGAQPGAANR